MRVPVIMLALAGLLLCCGTVFAEEPASLIANGDFKSGVQGWEGAGSDAEKDVSLVDVAGGKGLKLTRKQGTGAVSVARQGLKFKPQTLYRLTITGFGKDGAAVALRPACSKDGDYFKLCQSWATSSAPLAKSDAALGSVFLFDSGLKADQAFLAIRLPDGGPMEYTLTGVKLEELQSTKPDGKEFVIGHIGDSFTATSYLPFDDRIDRVLQGLIETKLKGRKIRNLNLGVDGEFLQDLVETGRYEKAIHQQFAHFDLLIIRYGANDRRKYDTAEFTKRLGALCDTLEKDYPGVKIVIGAGLYLKGADDINKKQYGPYWQACREFAAARKYPLADVYAAFEKANADDLTRGPADMHPSAKGVKLTAETEFAVIEPLLKGK